MDAELLPQVSKRREAVDCFNCSASRRQCDRIRHRCGTCSQCSEACGGYPRKWQWLTGVKARGKHKGRTMSITASSKEWQSTTPINHEYVFKQGNPQNKRPKCRGAKTSRPKAASGNCSKTASFEPARPVVLSNQQPQPSTLLQDEQPSPAYTSVVDVSQDFPLRPGNLCDPAACDPATLGYVEPIFEGFDFSQMHHFNTDCGNMLIPPMPIESIWPDQTHPWPFSTNYRPETPCLSLSALPAMETSQLLTLYDAELCVLPLTYDYDANPFRCMPQSSEHLLHAILAFSMQYVSRMRDGASPDGSTGQQVTAYKHSATNLSKLALPAAAVHLKQRVLDTTVILFNLDSFTSAAGPWSERLANALQMIESMGGISALTPSPRFHAQLTMFIWWDCNISLFARSQPVFPSCYHDFVLAHDREDNSNIFALTGVPKKLFQYFRELCELASEKEQVSKMKYATFDNKRVFELEQCIRDFKLEELDPESATDNEECVQTWYDYYHGANSWKYGLLLYIARVIKWDRSVEPCQNELTSLSRLVLDSVRCCREESRIRKQYLHPVFLAGAESTDSCSRKFVVEYFEQWYQWSKYAMFKEALELLRETWVQKDKNKNDASIWWSMLGNSHLNASQFLLG